MEYEMEELVPIVGKLAEKYTSKESTSITYEKAQQLMEAVLYCIHEGEEASGHSLAKDNVLSAERMYKIGVKCVEEKTKETLAMYNELMTYFSGYGNMCLNDTVEKGMPEFFKWYDCKYEPQNTILTLDYPVLTDNSKHTGIDKVHDYLLCIQTEQRFLNRFPYEYVIRILSGYDKNYKFMFENICEIVLMNVCTHILLNKEISDITFSPEEYARLQTMILSAAPGEPAEKLKQAINELIKEYYDNDEIMKEYLYRAADNILVRLKAAAENGNLSCIV